MICVGRVKSSASQVIANQVNIEDNDKKVTLNQYLEHLPIAKMERNYYRNQCEQARDCYPEDFTPYTPSIPCSFNGIAHYSWDYAQQIHYPANPQQPGPIYFKTPRKCSIFGISNDACEYQFNYRNDEIVSTGKGANPTISYVHHYFTNHGMGETKALIHADNCAGQNKNNYFLWYLAYRTIIGLNHDIEYSFMCVGHTKFSCDRCFGVLKKKTNITELWSLYDIADAVSNSGVNNEAELVGNHQGEVRVKVFDWGIWLGKCFRRLDGILSYQHFRFSHKEPGIVRCFKNPHDEEPALVKNILKITDRKTYLESGPNEIIPEGFSDQRKEYLYNEIRQFCKSGLEDLVAPYLTNKKAKV